MCVVAFCLGLECAGLGMSGLCGVENSTSETIDQVAAVAG